ncbi:AbrB/MazE/SpoVT family DNA-binding domain-containing protein [Paraclostridium sordellii]|uniref:Looped-hinge helix DNA binding domain n=1 Tax=Paraclostridium sordellii TaxID=1505 RepID=A0A0C7R3B3_PARSO|nr:AbrB/MazE/SpoVT family DNA-binding domain-containing protein [Paeniclostridium sordellii]QYE98789.1 AbrB/MazE/SpoVT family DNA-binding domain-containing protein [Paeniclostridium sordellii]CEN77562.1 looped-hinge helix DNA binding domain [[Clostridium] sordellii] [Paeniclostridium sordellii]CEO06100.1 looped-hinge helix DNA binding domain [[Clostridium] sordellii] [Paeniclostridium sordellii]CEP79718.1 looped-hinge helix DNA binding domain [[Clostridium] sordellii] [Paeniclostridium sordelli
MKTSLKDLSVGVERTVDNLGRIVVPKEMRDKLQFKENQVVSIKLFENHIQIEKSKTTCCFCGSEERLESYKNFSICNSCLSNIINKFNK